MKLSSTKNTHTTTVLLRALVIFLFSFLLHPALACDVCSFLEYGNLRNQHYLSLSYRHRALNGYNISGQNNQFSLNGGGNFKTLHQVTNPNTEITNSQEDQEVFRSYEVKFSLNFKNNWNIIASIPYNIHRVYFKEVTTTDDLASPPVFEVSDSTNTVSGIGDIRLFFEKYWIVKNKKWTFFARLSPGVQLPVGESRKSQNGQLFDPVIQPSMGVWGGMLRTHNTLIHRDRLGFSLAATMLKVQKKEVSDNSILASLLNTSTSTLSYQFGNRYNLQCQAFYIFNYYQAIKIIPSIGLYAEAVQADKLDNEKIDDLGGNSLFGQIGLELLYSDYSLQFNYLPNLANKMNGTQIENAGMFNASIVYRFGKKED